MADTFTKAQRSYCMSQIKSSGTAPETVIRKLLWAKGRRYRISHGLPGKPDIVFPSQRLAVFIDGCFWHGCRWHCRRPSSNVRYWRRKISGNQARDKKTARQLRAAGWRVARVWEHSIKKDPIKVIERIIQKLNAVISEQPE